ncbi:MAG: hypothetical protein SWI22_04905 [Pseudomonadota bacterium]|nr:hypothetical protein [Pseudomonadota bacterium]
MKLLVPAAAVAATLAACAPSDVAPVHASADTGGRCFTAADVDNFRVAGGSQIYVHSRRGGAFRLDASPNCFSSSTATIAVEPFGGGSSRICPGDEARVRATNGSSIPLTCVARVSGPITDSAISGLPG